MDFEKLKPWNWFKHEDDSATQIPVARNEASAKDSTGSNALTGPQNQAVGSLMQLHSEMDHLFNRVWRSFAMPLSSRLMDPSFSLGGGMFDASKLMDYRANLDISGNDQAYEVSIDLPGLSEDDLQIELNGNALIVKGQKEEKNEHNDQQYYRIERSVGAFQRTLSLPEDADREAISANMKNGLLVIQIPRKSLPKDKVKRISISS